MAEYVEEAVSSTFQIDAGQHAGFTFGPPTAGPVRVSLLAEGGPVSDDFPGGGSSFPEGRPFPVARRAGPGGGEPEPDRRPLPQEDFRIELLDVRGAPLATGDGFLQYDAPTASALSPIGLRRPWKVQISNRGSSDAHVSATVRFHGSRELLKQTLDLEFVNDKLNVLFNEVQPLRIFFENRETVTWAPPLTAITTTTTYLRLVADPAWAELYPELRDVEVSLGGHILSEVSSSKRITLRATTHDGAFAIRVRIEFPAPALLSIDVINTIGLISEFAEDVLEVVESLDPGDRPKVNINHLALDIFLVLRPPTDGAQPDPNPHFQVIAHPVVNTSPSWAAHVANAFFHLGFESLLPRAIRPHLDRYARNLQGWLLGDRGLEVTGSTEKLTLQYTGKDRTSAFTRPPASQTPLIPGNLQKINHIVVVMMENRSFDHMLGFLRLPTSGNDGRNGLGRADVNGLTGAETNPLNAMGTPYRVFSLATPRQGQKPSPDHETRGTRFPHDPGHSYRHTRLQRGNYPLNIQVSGAFPFGVGRPFPVPRNGGFILDFAQKLSGTVSAQDESLLRGEVMGYHPAQHVPTYLHLSEEFAVCDAWFASFPGHTWPNRFVSLTGGLAPGPDGEPEVDNPPSPGEFDPLEVETIFDHLSKEQVYWRYYEHDFAMLRTFSRYTFDDEHIVSIDDPDRGFFQAAKTGTLPSVTYIEPNLTDIPPGNDDHPPSDIQAGQELVGKIYEALRSSPQWPSTLFVITYDEHGGFYDHVFPASKEIYDPENPAAGSFAPLAHDPLHPEKWVDHYGMRVPALVVSPWIPRRIVDSTERDHTTILKTIIARFLNQKPPDMGLRVHLAPDLGPLLTEAAPRTSIPPLTSHRFRPDLGAATSVRLRGSRDDFRAFLQGFKRRVRGQ